MEKINILKNDVILHYQGFDLIKGGADNSRYYDDYVFIVGKDEILDFLNAEECDDESFKKLCEENEEKIMDHFSLESQDAEIKRQDRLEIGI